MDAKPVKRGKHLARVYMAKVGLLADRPISFLHYGSVGTIIPRK